AAGDAEQPGAEADGKREHPDADTPGGQVVSEFVDENQDADDENESQNRGHDLKVLTRVMSGGQPGALRAAVPIDPLHGRHPGSRPVAHRVPTGSPRSPGQLPETEAAL